MGCRGCAPVGIQRPCGSAFSSWKAAEPAVGLAGAGKAREAARLPLWGSLCWGTGGALLQSEAAE